jgi:hypothetical protein
MFYLLYVYKTSKHVCQILDDHIYQYILSLNKNFSFSLKDLSTSKSDSNNNIDIEDTSNMTSKLSSSSQKSMVVSINGGFELQTEDDYTAKRQINFNHDDNNKTSTTNVKSTFVPTPPTQAKQQKDLRKPPPPYRPSPSMNRPKSSDSGKRTDNFNSVTSRSWSDNKYKSTTNNQQRPKRYNE